MISIESLVAKESIKLQPFNQSWRTDNFAALAGVQGKPNEIAERICQRQNFRRQAALRASDGLILSPPLAPLAF